jgi:putative membrane protein
VHPSSITISRPTKQNQNGNDNGNDYGNGNDSVQLFLQDLSNLSKLENDLAIFQNSESKRDSSYTKSWKMEDWELHQRRSFFRYKRHLTTWLTSTTARAVFPTVIALSCWALLIQYLANKFDALGNFLSNSSFTKGVASIGGPLSLLLALRTNRSLNRLFEARSMFGKFVRASTSLTSMTATYVGPKNRDTALLIGRYLSIYGWCMKGMFRREPDDLLILAMLPPKEAQWLLKQTTTYNMDTPTCMHARLRSLMATAIQDIPLSAANAMEDRLNVLESALGVNKRLLGSPIPPTYTRHTSRVLCLYLGLLPFALVGASLGQNDISFIFSMLVTIGATAYVFVGIDEIGVEIENPFPLIPMQYIATVIQRNVGHQMRMMDDLPAP